MRVGLRCLHPSIFIETPSLEGLPTKAKEDPSPHEMRLSPAGHQPSISWSRGNIIVIIIIVIIIIIIITTVTIIIIIIIIITIMSKYFYRIKVSALYKYINTCPAEIYFKGEIYFKKI